MGMKEECGPCSKRHERRLVRLEYSFILFRVKITKLLPTSDEDVKLKQGKCTDTIRVK